MTTNKSPVFKVVTITIGYDPDGPIPSDADLESDVNALMGEGHFSNDDELIVEWDVEIKDFPKLDGGENDNDIGFPG